MKKETEQDREDWNVGKEREDWDGILILNWIVRACLMEWMLFENRLRE